MIVAASGPEASQAVASIRVTQMNEKMQKYGRTGGMRITAIKGFGGVASKAGVRLW